MWLDVKVAPVSCSCEQQEQQGVDILFAKGTDDAAEAQRVWLLVLRRIRRLGCLEITHQMRFSRVIANTSHTSSVIKFTLLLPNIT